MYYMKVAIDRSESALYILNRVVLSMPSLISIEEVSRRESFFSSYNYKILKVLQKLILASWRFLCQKFDFLVFIKLLLLAILLKLWVMFFFQKR